jgi:hypothetical protein
MINAAFWSIGLYFLAATVAQASSGTSDCTGANLTNCIATPLSQVVNEALRNGSLSKNFSISSQLNDDSADNSASATPMSLTINDCAKILQDRLASFQTFNTSTDRVWSDVVSTQTTMRAVEQSANDILTSESEFAAKLSQMNELIQNATNRAGQLTDWINGEKVIRNQLSDIYTQLDQRVREDSKQVLLTASSIRDALFKMQTVHDHATKVLTAVGDAETHMYDWAGNVSSKVNAHTVDLVSIAQTVQFRANQLSAIQDPNTQLNWIVTQLVNKYGSAAVLAASKAYDAETLAMPSGSASVTPASNSGTIKPI